MERVSVPRAISEMKANTITITCHFFNGKIHHPAHKNYITEQNKGTVKLLFLVVKIKTYFALLFADTKRKVCSLC
jgi:hypothetical protein